MRPGAVARTLIAAVRLYRAFPRSRLPSCRFDPTCSQYALDAVRMWGALRGGGLALRRICRCHPWGGWGYDPVPETSDRHRRDHRALTAAGLLEAEPNGEAVARAAREPNRMRTGNMSGEQEVTQWHD